MNILHIIDICCPPEQYHLADGTDRVITQLCHYFVNTCHDVCYLGYFRENEIRELASEFSDSINLSYPIDTNKLSLFLKEHDIDIIQYNVPGKQNMQQIPAISKVAHTQHIPLVYCFHFMPGREWCDYSSFEEIMLSLKHHKPLEEKVKFWLISKCRPYSEKFIKIKAREKYCYAYRNCDKIIQFVEPYIDKYLDIVKGNDRSKFIAIPNPLTFNEFIDKEDVKTKKKKVIIVGRLSERQKRVSLALKTWQLVEKNPLLDEWTLSIVGNGKDEAFYHWLADKYHLRRVSFEGHQNPRPYYKQASIMMSTAGYEGWPMVFMEAMPMGCCCLAFDSYDAIHEMITDGYDGCIIPNNDIRAYYDRLSYLMLNEESRIQIGMNAIDSSARFTMEKIGAKYKALYEELVQQYA